MRPTDIVIDAEKVFLFDCVTESNNLYSLILHPVYPFPWASLIFPLSDAII